MNLSLGAFLKLFIKTEDIDERRKKLQIRVLVEIAADFDW